VTPIPFYPRPVHATMSDLAFTVAGDIAYVHNIQDAYWTGKDGKQQEQVAHVSHVYCKQHGHWLIVQEHVSVPVDFTTMKPDLLSRL